MPGGSYMLFRAASAALLLLSGGAFAQGRWEADPALSQGMNDIRTEVVNHHTLITHRRLPVAMARSFAGRVGSSVSNIRHESKVEANARRALDPLLDTIDSSAQVIGAGGDSVRQMDALFSMTRALETYGQTFDDPGWKPVQNR